MKMTTGLGERKKKAGWHFRLALRLGLIFLILPPFVFGAIALTITGSWSFTLSSGNLQGGAGSEFTTEYESASNQVLLKVGGAGGNTWRVDVQRVDTSWPSTVTLYVRRTGNGTGKGTIYDGTTYHLVTTTTTTWMTGAGDRDQVPLQEKVGSLSVSIGQATFTTAIRYTLVQTS